MCRSSTAPRLSTRPDLNRGARGSDHRGVCIVCWAVAIWLLKRQVDETPVWTYLLSIQLVFVGIFLLAFGHDILIPT